MIYFNTNSKKQSEDAFDAQLKALEEGRAYPTKEEAAVADALERLLASNEAVISTNTSSSSLLKTISEGMDPVTLFNRFLHIFSNADTAVVNAAVDSGVDIDVDADIGVNADVPYYKVRYDLDSDEDSFDYEDDSEEEFLSEMTRRMSHRR